MLDRSIQTCPACARPFVVAEEILAVLPAGDGYLMRLGCTNCGHEEIGAFDEDTMSALDAALERSQRQIEGAIRHLVDQPLWTDVLAEATA
jgi:hypothetical protein